MTIATLAPSLFLGVLGRFAILLAGIGLLFDGPGTDAAEDRRSPLARPRPFFGD